MLDSWPALDDANNEVYAAISNSMNYLLIYPIKNPHRWNEFVTVGPDEVARVFSKWRGSVPTSPVDGLR